jgi:hypothetical protein
MTRLMRLGLGWGLDKMMMMPVEPGVHDYDKEQKILEDSDFEHEELLLNL